MKRVLLFFTIIAILGCSVNEMNLSDKEKKDDTLEKSDEISSGDTKGIVFGLKPEYEVSKTQDEMLEEIEQLIGDSVIPKRDGRNSLFKKVHSTTGLVNDYISKNPAKASLSINKLEDEAYKELKSPLEQAIYRDYMFELKSPSECNTIINELKKLSFIDYVQKDELNELISDDRYYTTNPKNTSMLWGIPATETQKAWDITMGEDVIVAVVDTGVNYNHEDLKNNMWTDQNGNHGYDFSDNDSNPLDNEGHGTHVAGTIAAVGNNGLGVVGMAPKAKIMAVKIFPNAYDTVCANAIRFAVDNGAKVMNNSWGPTSRKVSNPVVEKAIDYAHAKGAVIVFAAGNSNDDADYYSGGNYSKTISVAAVDAYLNRASFSNYGSTVDIAAPGVRIISTWYNGSYNSIQGTSMASPHVAGTAALLLSKYPELTNEQVREAIKSSATTLSTDRYVGAGMLNSLKALESIQPDEAAPVIVSTSRIEVESSFTVYGSDFLETQGDIWLLPAGQTAQGYKLDITTWENDRIIATLPASVQAGNYTVLVIASNSKLSNYFAVTVVEKTLLPVISGITNDIYEDEDIVINGSNLGSAGKVMAGSAAGSIELNVKEWSDTMVILENTLSAGIYNIELTTASGHTSNNVELTINEKPVVDPQITMVQNPVYENEDIIVNGISFGNTTGVVYLWVDGKAVNTAVKSWSDTEIVITNSNSSGEYYVIVYNTEIGKYTEWVKFLIEEKPVTERTKSQIINEDPLFANFNNWKSLIGSYGNDFIKGSDNNDTIRSYAGTNVIYPGSGSDIIYGGSGNDTYLYIAGDGKKTILDSNGSDTIIFFNIPQENIVYTQSGSDLVISSTCERVDVTVKYFYYNSNYRIEYANFK